MYKRILDKTFLTLLQQQQSWYPNSVLASNVLVHFYKHLSSSTLTPMSLYNNVFPWKKKNDNIFDGLELAGSGMKIAHENISLPSWMESIWYAVPKRKPSYSVKRKRQMNPVNQNEKELHHAYPCPKCDKGYIKLRHHLCPCDQEKLNCKAVVKVRYGISRRRYASENTTTTTDLKQENNTTN